MSVQERIRAFIRFKKLSISQFCRTLDVSPAYVSSMHKSMSLAVIQRISLTYPELNLRWLQTGEGEMIKRQDEVLSDVPVEIATLCRECDRKDGKIEILKETIVELREQLNEMTALYCAAMSSIEKLKPGGGTGGGGEDDSSSFRRHSMVSGEKGNFMKCK